MFFDKPNGFYKNCKCGMNKMMRQRRFSGLNRQEKMFLATILGVTFMRGICIGMYINEK